MSVESITWALKVPVPASSAKFVLVVLANQANDETGLAFPSVAYLSEATGQDRKTVISNIAKLVEWGLIEDTGQRVGATKQVIVYRLLKGSDLFAEQSQKRNRTENGTVPKTDGNSTVFPRKQSQKRDTEPSINHQEPAVSAAGVPTPAGIASIALRKAGVSVNSQNPNLLAALAEGVTVEHLTEVALNNPGKPAGYVIAIARRERATPASAVHPIGVTREPSRKLSASEQTRAAILARRRAESTDGDR